MSTLTGNKISLTYKSLIKTADNDVLTAVLKELSDGLGNNSGVFLNTGGDLKSTGILEFANFKGTSTSVTINKLVNEADGISNNDNDTSLATSAAVKDYVDTHVTTQDLDFSDGTNPGAVDLDSQVFAIVGTSNEIETSASNQQLQIGLPNDVTISGTYTGTTFLGDLSGTINTATTATTQTAGDNSTKVATTAYVDTLDAASDLDFQGNGGTGAVNLNTQIFSITGVTNSVVTTASNQGLSIAFDPTGVNLPDNSTAITQTAGDNSTKVATTAYVDVLDSASDLDIAGDTGTGDVNLNTQTFTLSGTTNQVITSVSGQEATFSLPSTVHRNLQGNVTGDLTGNADTATAWETARDLILSSEATGTISNVDGTQNVTGAVTLLNSAVTGKVLTGLPTPAAGNIQSSDTILEAFGKLQSQVSSISNGLIFKGSWDAATNTPTLTSGGGEVDSGTTTGQTAFKLIETGQNFNTTVTIGDKVINQVDGTTALVTVIDSNTQLTLDADIMLSGEAYTIDASPFIPQGNYYVVNYAGTTNLNGITDWSIGDWVIADADNRWSKLDHSQVDGQGTPGHLPVFATATTIGDSIVAQSGTALTVTGSLSTTLGASVTGDFAVNTDKFTVAAASGNTAFAGDLAINTDKFTVNATTGNVVVAGDVSLPDNKILKLGTGNDLTLKHTATDSFIENQTGHLNIVNYADGKDIKFWSDDGSGGIAEYFKVDSASDATQFFKPIYLKDNIKALFGNSSDFRIYHDGSHSYIEDTGTGDLRIKSNGASIALLGNSNEDMILAIPDGAVKLYYNNSAKLETTSTGVSVSGGGTFAGSVTITPTNNVNLLVNDSGTELELISGTNGGTYGVVSNHKAHSFKFLTDGGSGTYTDKLTIDSSGNVGIGVTPEAWTVFKPLQIGQASAFVGRISSNQTDITTNFYYDGAEKRITTGYAQRYTQTSDGKHQFWTAGTDSADSTITFSQKFEIANNGNATFAGNVTATQGTIGQFTFSTNVLQSNNLNNSGARIRAAVSGETTPTYSFEDDTNTGMFTTGADILKFATGGTTAITIDTSQNSTFAGNITATQITATNGLNYLKRNTDASLQLRSENTRSGLFITKPATDTVMGSALVLEDESYRLGTANYYHMVMLPNGTTYFDGGSVGIGTDSPRNDSGFVTLQVGNTTTAASQIVLDDNDSNGPWRIISNQSLIINDDATERMRITNSGNSFFNYSNQTIETYGNGVYGGKVVIKASGAEGLSLINNSIGGAAQVAINFTNEFVANQYNYIARIIAEPEQSWTSDAATRDAGLSFFTAQNGSAGEKMRITSGGVIQLGGSTSLAAKLAIESYYVYGIFNNSNRPTQQFFQDFRYSGTQIGTILGNNTSVAYNTSSDYRLKEDLQDFAGLDMVSKIPVYDFKWKIDESRSYGVMAHELQKVLPQAVSGEKDAEEMQSVDYSKIVPLLVKSIQELKAEVDLLKQECKCK